MKEFWSSIFISILLLSLATCKHPVKQVRFVKAINSGWTFNYLPGTEVDSMVVLTDFDDLNWQAVAIPHTWSTYEITGELHPFICNASERGDQYWWYGLGYYRKKFSIAKELRTKKVFVEFDGVQKYSKVFLNGKYLGDHKGGFTVFF